MTEKTEDLLYEYVALSANAVRCLSDCGPGTDEYKEWNAYHSRLTDQYFRRNRPTTTTEKNTMSEFDPMHAYTWPMTFSVYRRADESGTSGTGVVAMGTLFPDGTTVVQWQTHVRSVVIYQSYADALHIHGHGDKTGLVFHEDPTHIWFPGGVREDFNGS